MMSVPKTIASTPPHISGAKPRSMLSWSDIEMEYLLYKKSITKEINMKKNINEYDKERRLRMQIMSDI